MSRNKCPLKGCLVFMALLSVSQGIYQPLDRNSMDGFMNRLFRTGSMFKKSVHSIGGSGILDVTKDVGLIWASPKNTDEQPQLQQDDGDDLLQLEFGLADEFINRKKRSPEENGEGTTTEATDAGAESATESSGFKFTPLTTLLKGLKAILIRRKRNEPSSDNELIFQNHVRRKRSSDDDLPTEPPLYTGDDVSKSEAASGSTPAPTKYIVHHFENYRPGGGGGLLGGLGKILGRKKRSSGTSVAFETDDAEQTKLFRHARHKDANFEENWDIKELQDDKKTTPAPGKEIVHVFHKGSSKGGGLLGTLGKILSKRHENDADAPKFNTRRSEDDDEIDVDESEQLWHQKRQAKGWGFSMPSMPSMPKMPSMSGRSMPSMPSMPNMPNMPSREDINAKADEFKNHSMIAFEKGGNISYGLAAATGNLIGTPGGGGLVGGVGNLLTGGGMGPLGGIANLVGIGPGGGSNDTEGQASVLGGLANFVAGTSGNGLTLRNVLSAGAGGLKGGAQRLAGITEAPNPDAGFQDFAKDMAADALADSLIGDQGNAPTLLGFGLGKVGNTLESLTGNLTGGALGGLLGTVGGALDQTLGAGVKSVSGDLMKDTFRASVKGAANNVDISQLTQKKRSSKH